MLLINANAKLLNIINTNLSNPNMSNFFRKKKQKIKCTQARALPIRETLNTTMIFKDSKSKGENNIEIPKNIGFRLFSQLCNYLLFIFYCINSILYD